MGLTRIRADQVANIGYTTVRVIALANVSLNGGAPLTVDGVELANSNKILVVGQDTASQNGIYRVSTAGTGTNGTWVRAPDFNQTGEIEAGLAVMVTEGTNYNDTLWKLTTNNPIVIGETALSFARNSAFDFGNIVANGTAVIASSESDTVTFTAGNNVLLTANADSKTINFDILAGAAVSAAGNDGDIQFNSAGAFGASGNLTFVGSELSVTGAVAVTGNVTTGNVSGTTGAFTTVTGNGRALTSLNATNIDTGTLPSGRLSGTYTITVSGAATTAGTVTTAAQPNITSVGTLSSLAVTGNISAGNVIASNFDSVNADVAEIYKSDLLYSPGTVVEFGGTAEITQSTEYASSAIAGIISTAPAFTMNTAAAGLAVALQGRVPCRVVGKINKGDLVTSSSIPGVATRLGPDQWKPGCVLGKSLENYDSDLEGTIEVVAGRL